MSATRFEVDVWNLIRIKKVEIFFFFSYCTRVFRVLNMIDSEMSLQIPRDYFRPVVPLNSKSKDDIDDVSNHSFPNDGDRITGMDYNPLE